MMQSFSSLTALCSNFLAQAAGAEAADKASPLITDDAVIFGLLLVILAVIFKTASIKHKFWKRFYTFCPVLLLCYFIPSLLGSFDIVATDEDGSSLYFVAKNYLLPTSLVLLTLSIDLKGIIGLGPKALILFLTGTAGILLGGPLAILIVSKFSPEMVAGDGPESVWRGMATCAGSWIGGGANQAAMKEVFEVGDKIFSQMITVDVLVANVWMAGLLIIAGKSRQIDNWLKADTSAIDTLKDRISAYQAETLRIPKTADTLMVLATGFAVTALSHFLSGRISGACGALADSDPSFKWIRDFNLTSTFFWLVILATTGGVLLSFTRLRNLEGVGASRIATVFLYLLVVTIGLKMDIKAIFNNPGVFLIGGIWMAFHIILLAIVTWLIKAPVFFMAVGSKANIGGAVSAPIVAAAFHPSLAPVGVLLAVLGYALGTYGAWLCGLMMQAVAPPV